MKLFAGKCMFYLQSEFEWNGDLRRGLGDYRIPKTMLTDTSGNRLTPADAGIVERGKRKMSTVTLSVNLWNRDYLSGINSCKVNAKPLVFIPARRLCTFFLFFLWFYA